jgi:hypothetical protein
MSFGGSLSSTVTVKAPVIGFPDVSVAITVTVVIPIGKADPEGGLLPTVTPGQLSVVATV